MKSKKIIIFSVIFIVVILILQLLIVKRENPKETNIPAWDSQFTKNTFMKACADCHSNQTVWPWYSYVPPFSFIIYRDVIEGREHFNISEYINEKANKAGHEFESGAMPVGIYILMHPDASISGENRKKFIQGLEATFGKYKRGELEKNRYSLPTE